MALLLRGSTRTLYGGSVLTRCTDAPSSKRSTCTGLPLSPQKAMVAQQPQIARLRDCFIRWFRHLIRIGLPVLHTRVEQSVQLVLIETKQAEVIVAGLQLVQFQRTLERS